MFDTTTPDLNCSNEMTEMITQLPFDTSLWAAPRSWLYGKGSGTKDRHRQSVGHKEKVIASRRKRNKAAKKARKKNR